MGSIKDKNLKNSNIPLRYMNNILLSPSVLDEETFNDLNNIKLNIKKFVDDGNNLLICSNNVGNGKTTWATKILKQYIEDLGDSYFNYPPAFFINVTNMLNEMKLAISNPELQYKINNYEKCILNSNLVIFDDLGVKDFSEYDTNRLYYWIEHRTSNLKSSIYTSNLVPSQLQKALDNRLYSRIINYSIIKEIKDGDSRGVKVC